MDFNLSKEQVMLRDSVERFVREQYPFELRRALANSEEGFSRSQWQQFAELGWLGLSLPEEVGGLDCSFVETALIMEQLGRGMVLEPYLTTAVLCSRIIERADAQALRRSLLPAIIDGTLLVALAHTEADSRFDLDQVQETTARKQGDGFLIDGSKAMVLNGPSADQLIVSATLQSGFTLFIVNPKTAGVTLSPYPLIDGSRAADITFEGVRIDADALLVGTEHAAAVLDEAVDRATLAIVAEAVGSMSAVLESTSEYIKNRVQFGQPLGKFQSLQHRMAEAFVELQESRSMLYRGMAYLDGSVQARRAAVSAAKALVGTAGRRVGRTGIQLHGGMGLTDECRISHLFKKLSTFEKTFGDIDFHIERFAHLQEL